jgi:hypothetical protein
VAFHSSSFFPPQLRQIVRDADAARFQLRGRDDWTKVGVTDIAHEMLQKLPKAQKAMELLKHPETIIKGFYEKTDGLPCRRAPALFSQVIALQGRRPSAITPART